MTECIALLRGINVGRAKRITMGDLRGLFVGLGHKNVRTLLNSGNVLFQCTRPNTGKLALSIQNAIADTCGFSVPVTVVTATDLAAIIRENPLLPVAVDPAKYLVAFVAHPSSLDPLRPLLKDSWAPDALAIGSPGAYFLCAAGVADSKRSPMFPPPPQGTVIKRNLANVLKLRAG